METEILEYIEGYFQQTMADSERAAFEERINADKDFANDVAFYISARQTLKQELLVRKQIEWGAAAPAKDKLLSANTPVKKINAGKWWSYAAAACLLGFIAFYFFDKKSSTPQQLADNYIKTELLHMSITMDASKDSLVLGMAAYNDKLYNKALSYFIGVANAHPDNIDAKRLAGNVYLVTNNYNKALQQYSELANMQGLVSNPGVFLEAVTLMQRNKEGDLAKAKQLLQQVVKENLDNYTEAAEWLKKF